MSDFTTYREGSLHAALKARYAATIPDARVEALVDGFVVDVAGPDELVEIQTASFGSASRKLERLVASHRVVLVHPIAIERWLVLVDAEGAIIRRRRSPKRGLALDLFDELVRIPGLVADPSFRIELLLIHEEEIRGPIPAGARYRYPREWWRLDRRLLSSSRRSGSTRPATSSRCCRLACRHRSRPRTSSPRPGGRSVSRCAPPIACNARAPSRHWSAEVVTSRTIGSRSTVCEDDPCMSRP